MLTSTDIRPCLSLVRTCVRVNYSLLIPDRPKGKILGCIDFTDAEKTHQHVAVVRVLNLTHLCHSDTIFYFFHQSPVRDKVLMWARLVA